MDPTFPIIGGTLLFTVIIIVGTCLFTVVILGVVGFVIWR